MKNNKKRLIFLILILLWMLMIFNFSNQTSEKSGGLSKQVTDVVLKVVRKQNTTTNSQKKELEHIIRKCAHFSIYFLGGIIIYNLITTYPINLPKRILLTQGLGTLYACTDEFHQLFTPGRGASIKDVVIDSSGILLSLIVIILFKKIKSTNIPTNISKSF